MSNAGLGSPALALEATTLIRRALGKGVAIRFLIGDRGPTADSRGHPGPPHHDSDQTLHMAGELALVGEVRVRGDQYESAEINSLPPRVESIW
jgi:hypothetical protein